MNPDLNRDVFSIIVSLSHFDTLLNVIESSKENQILFDNLKYNHLNKNAKFYANTTNGILIPVAIGYKVGNLIYLLEDSQNDGLYSFTEEKDFMKDSGIQSVLIDKDNHEAFRNFFNTSIKNHLTILEKLENVKPLEDFKGFLANVKVGSGLSIKELKEKAKLKKIKGYSTMKKDELIKALR